MQPCGAEATDATTTSTNPNTDTSDPATTASPKAKTAKELNLPLAHTTAAVVKKGNKFTDGLDLSLTTDWASELRPSMRKLRQAMDGLLKTARLMHSVQRLQQDMQRTSATLATMYRRDVCFSQAVSSAREFCYRICKLRDLGDVVRFLS